MFVERRRKRREDRDRLTDLAEEIRRVEKGVEVQPEIPENAEDKRQTAKASQIGFDFAASVLVCAFLGGVVDHFLGSAPRVMLLMLLVGFVVGLTNVWRALNGYGSAIGFRRKK